VRGPSCVASSSVISGQETSPHHAGYGHVADGSGAGGAVQRTACSGPFAGWLATLAGRGSPRGRRSTGRAMVSTGWGWRAVVIEATKEPAGTAMGAGQPSPAGSQADRDTATRPGWRLASEPASRPNAARAPGHRVIGPETPLAPQSSHGQDHLGLGGAGRVEFAGDVFRCGLGIRANAHAGAPGWWRC
jgi:hypothetical protein